MRFRLFWILVFVVQNLESVWAQNEPTSLGYTREDHVINSEVTGENYRLFVSLPHAYSSQNEEVFPVIYVLDINSEDALQLGYYHSVFSQLPNVPEFILVGVGFAPDDEHIGLRTAHFSPSNIKDQDSTSIANTIASIEKGTNQRPITPEMQSKWRTGRANEFSSVLKDELLPFIENQYRSTEAEGIFAASLAGLFITWELFLHPELFYSWVITSPSLWWNDFEIFEDTAETQSKLSTYDGRIYLAVGGLEDQDMLESFERFRSLLQLSNAKNVLTEVIENEDHISVIPVSYVKGIQYIFSR